MSTERPATSGKTDGSWILLEENERFSNSAIWTIMKAYYGSRGPQAWHSGDVPHYATCNTYIAQCYADVVMAYLRELDRNNKLDHAAPVYVAELAAGVGAFAAYFLRKFGELKEESSLRGLDVKYVMTDFTPTNLGVVSTHPHLAPYHRAGALTFGKFDVDTDDSIDLISGEPLTAGSLANPMVVLGNYAFDTFRHDLFRVTDGKLYCVGITTRAPGPGPVDLASDGLISKLRTQYTDNPIEPSSFYDDPVLNLVLTDYAERLADTMFTIPRGGMTAIRRLLDISGGRMLLMSSDKGFAHEHELYIPHADHRQVHGGAFSMMVNFNAIGAYFQRYGGRYAATPKSNACLHTVGCVLGGDDEFPDTLSMFRRSVKDFSPGSFFDLMQLESQANRRPPLNHFLLMLRLSGYDPSLVFHNAAHLREQCKNLPEPMIIEVRLALQKAWENYYPSRQNLPFELARILMQLGRPKEAAGFNQVAIDLFGENPAAYLNMGICHYYGEDPAEALRCFERAKELSPTSGQPREWIARINGERARAETHRPVRQPTPRADTPRTPAPTKTGEPPPAAAQTIAAADVATAIAADAEEAESLQP